MNKLLSILTIVLMLTACGSNPPTTEDGECAWTVPVKIAGSGTGEMAYVPTVSTPDDDCDICDAAPLTWFALEIISIEPWIVEITYQDEPLELPFLVELDCGMASIMIWPYYPDEPEDYAIGDMWTFGLE